MTPTETRLQDAILEMCVSTYVLPDGTHIQGQSISYLSQSLRDAGWRGVSNLNDLESIVERLGFKVVRAQMLTNGRLRTPARVVTL